MDDILQIKIAILEEVAVDVMVTLLLGDKRGALVALEAWIKAKRRRLPDDSAMALQVEAVWQEFVDRVEAGVRSKTD